MQEVALLLIFFFWSGDYANLIFNLFITIWKCKDTPTLLIVYIGKYLVLRYITKILILTICSLISYICWSVICMSWVSKLCNFFLTCSEAKARFIFEGYKYCPLWQVHLQLSNTFSGFFFWSLNCSWVFFSHFFGQ